MSAAKLPVEASRSSAPPSSAIEHVTGIVAILGGMLALAVALLATTSVLMRWLVNAPIDGDFEFVKIATAVAVFAYLPYTQARRGNIMVDTFTGWMSQRARDVIDAFWDLIYAAFMSYIAYSLVIGTLEAIHTGETTMQRQLLIWPSIGVSALLCALLAVTAFATAWRLLRAAWQRVSP